MSLIERLGIRPNPTANEKAAVIVMAAEIGLTDDEAKAFADEYPTEQLALPELKRKAAMRFTGDELTAAEVEQVVASTATPVEAKKAAVDMVCEKRIAEEGPETKPTAQVGHSWDSGEGFNAKMIDGLRARMNAGHVPRIGREYASMTFGEMAAECMRAAGVKVNSQRKAIEMVYSGDGGLHSTSDFPLILSGAINQELAQAYVQQMAALMDASRRLPGPDFRQRVRPRLSTGPELTKGGEASELTYGTFVEDGEYAPLVETYRKGFRMTREGLVNDNMNAFAEIPTEMARGAITTVRRVLVALLEANAGAGQTMRDGNPLFHADHGNLATTGAPISVTTVNNATTAMRRQTGLQGEVIDVRPWALVVPPELETSALQLVAANTPNQVDQVNPFAGSLQVIVEPGLTDTTRWYICADPAISEGLAHSYLNDSNGPRVEERIGWEVEGMEWKVVLDFGAAFVDFRSWYANDGE